MSSLQIIGNASAAPPPNGACSAYLVWSPAATVLLDIGPGSLGYLRAATSVHALDAIFITHMHTDHFLDLLALNVALFTEPGPRTEHGARWRLPVYLPPGGFETVDACFKALSRGVSGTNAARYAEALAVREYDPAETITVADQAVTFIGPTKHSQADYGMRLQVVGGGLLGYTGDTARCDAAVEVGRGADIFLAECTLMTPGPASVTHTCADELVEMALLARPGQLRATHFLDHSPSWRAELARRLERDLGATETSVVSRGDIYDF